MRFPSRWTAPLWTAPLLAVLLVVSCGFSQEAPAVFSRRNPVVEAVRKTRAAIVTIQAPRASGRDTTGTGVLVDERGFLVTNRHVLGAARKVKVLLHDGTETVGDTVAVEAAWDLAVVRIRPPRKLQALPLGPAADLMVGETVIAVGHPYGYTNTVSVGIVSALGRTIEMPTGEVLSGLIQTDASINPGNSGGPLLNVNGELIGINVALREGAQGIAFAINAGTVKHVLGKHLSAVRVAGVEHGLTCTEKVVGETGPDRQRLVVAEVGSPVLKKGDQILAVADRGVSNTFDLERALWDKRPGEQVDLRVLRDGERITLRLTLRSGNGAVPSAALQVPRHEPLAITSVPVGTDR